MNESRASRTWTLIGLAALAVTAGVYSSRRLMSREPQAMLLSVDADMRDAVAEPQMERTQAFAAARGVLGKPVPGAWFETPESRHAELDRRLLSSRRRRALAQAVSVQ
jgi:hypothetical protein